MNHEEKSPYSFIRKNCSYTDTLSRDGKGAQVKSGIGLICPASVQAMIPAVTVI